VVKQSVSLHGEHKVAQYVGIPAFSISTGLAFANILLPTLYGHDIDTPPNTLSHVFSDTYRAPDADQSFLWAFMRKPIPGSDVQMTRREILLHHWHDFCGLKIDHKQLLSRLSALPEGENKLNESATILAERIALLHDLRTHIEEFDGSLYELHQAICFN
jgi:hypothetical protein